jgi:hypothetical protein
MKSQISPLTLVNNANNMNKITWFVGAISLLFGIVFLSHIGNYNFEKSRLLSWEASTLLTPLGYAQYGFRGSEVGKFDAVFWKPAKPRSRESNSFPWKTALSCYVFVFLSSGVLLWKLRESI